MGSNIVYKERESTPVGLPQVSSTPPGFENLNDETPDRQPVDTPGNRLVFPPPVRNDSSTLNRKNRSNPRKRFSMTHKSINLFNEESFLC